MRSNKGFTLIELLLYAALLAVVGGMLTGVMITSIRTQKIDSSTNEVTQQLDFVLGTVQRLVRESSLVELTYEGTTTTDTCSQYCSLKLRMENTPNDPTIISSDANGVYLKEGSSEKVALTTDEIIVDSLAFTKTETPGGHATVQIDATFSRNTENPQLAVTKSIQSAISKATAATFDDNLIPNQTGQFDVGTAGSEWKNARFSGNLYTNGLNVINSLVGINTTNPGRPLSIQALNLDWLELKDSSGVTQWHFVETNAGDLDITETDVANGRLYLKAGGKVGINTVSPGDGGVDSIRLDVNDGSLRVSNQGPDNTQPYRPFIYLNHKSTAPLDLGGSIAWQKLGSDVGELLFNHDDGQWWFYDSGTGATRLSIGTDGKVGINKADPDFPLHVNGQGIKIENNNPDLFFYESDTVGQNYNIRQNYGDLRFQTCTDDFSCSNKIYFTSTGIGRFTSGVQIGSVSGVGSDPLCWDGSGESLIGDCTSLREFKENIGNLALGLDEVLKLQPRTFNWISDDETDRNSDLDLGFIAEEVEQVDPLLVTYRDGELSGVKYNRMVALLTSAIQELSSELDEIKAGVIEVKNLVLEKLTAETVRVNKMEYVDQATGDIYCTWIENGEFIKEIGECE